MHDWRSVLVRPDTSMLKAIEVIDRGTLQLVLVTDAHRRLLGIVTDGDIRRGILMGLPMSTPVEKLMNRQPVVASQVTGRAQRRALLRDNRLHHLPLVDDQGRLVDLEVVENFIAPRVKDNWVVLMAGGLGSRLRPLTNDCPKPLLKVGAKPILQLILESLVETGFHRFFIAVNYKAQMVEDHFGDGGRWGVSIEYLREPQARGTAGALALLPSKPEQPLLVMNGDLATQVNFAQLLDFHEDNKARMTLCVVQQRYGIPYGVVRMNQQWVLGLDEKPHQDVFINAGIYVLDPKLLALIPSQQTFDMPDLLGAALQEKQSVAAFPLHEYWLDIGRREDFDRVHREYAGKLTGEED